MTPDTPLTPERPLEPPATGILRSGAGRPALAQSVAARPWLCALLIFLVAAALRGAMAFSLPREVIWPDGHRYLRVAADLLGGDGFGSISDDRASVPAQPLLIAAVQLVWGPSVLALRLFFAALGAATCVVGYLLARELFDPAVALVAGALLAVYPYYIYLFALFEYPQPFFIFAVGLAFWLVYRFLRTRRLPQLLLAGLCLGAAVLAVPTALAFVPVLAACLVLARIPRPVLSAAVLLVAAALPVAAWTARNEAAYGELILVNQAGGINFWLANNETYFEHGKAAVTPPCDPVNSARLFCRQVRGLEARLHAEGLSDAQWIAAEEAASWRAGWAFVRASPARAVRLGLRKLLELWSPLPDAVTPVAGRVGAAKAWASALTYVPVLLLALGGVVLLRRERRRLLPLYAYILTFSAVYSVYLPTTRYRLPIDFFLMMFAAYALCRGAEAVVGHRSGRALLGAARVSSPSAGSASARSPPVSPPSR